jgi:hypothetical protein
MNRIRLWTASASAVMAGGFLVMALFAPVSSASVVAPVGSITDLVADTVTDDLGNLIPAARADLVSSSVDYQALAIIFSMRVREPVDPLKDTNWFSEYTFGSWELDTTGDKKPDYDVQFTADSDTGKLAGFVVKWGTDTIVCDAPAFFGGADNFYITAVDPKCVGNPASVSYRAVTYYDTRRGDDNADVATDSAPDQGMTGPINKAATPTTLAPTQATQAPQTTAPPATQPTPATGKAPSPAPQAAPTTGPTPKPAPAAAPKPAPTAEAKPAPAIKPAPTRPVPFGTTTTPAPAANPPVGTAAPQLAQTGPGTALRLAGFGGALLFAGLSLVLACGRRRLPLPIAS